MLDLCASIFRKSLFWSSVNISVCDAVIPKPLQLPYSIKIGVECLI